MDRNNNFFISLGFMGIAVGLNVLDLVWRGLESINTTNLVFFGFAVMFCIVAYYNLFKSMRG